MFNFLKKKYLFLYIFLIPVFFILHNYFDFYLLVDIKEIKTEIFIWLLLPFLFAGFSYILFRDLSKAILFSCFFLLVFFFVPSFKSFAQTSSWFSLLGKYSVLVILLFVLALILFFWLKKKKQAPVQMHQFLFTLFVVLLIYEPIRWLTGGKEKTIRSNRLTVTGVPSLEIKKHPDTTQLPDIYYLLFDELAASSAYKTLLNYDNSYYDSTITHLGFKVVPATLSASNHTHPSMSSVFNLSYLPFDENQPVNFKQMHALVQSINENPLIPFLLQHNYTIHNAGIFRLNEIKGLSKPDLWTLRSASDMITSQTLLNNLWNEFGWMVESKLPGKPMAGEKLVGDTALINEALTRLNQTLLLKETHPKFIYTHFYLPHGPVKFNRDGKVLQWNSYQEYRNKNQSDTFYREQVIYTFKLITQLCSQILKQNKKPAVIILQGDHGLRNYDTARYSKNLSYQPYAAFYFPDGNYSSIPDSFYLPNTFRIVLNKYFQQQLQMLTPKTYYLQLEKDGVLFKR
jgi:heme/copper-type cytochrome/quinol oxidase subunit 4